MTIDPIAAQLLMALIINIPIWYVMRANLRKTNTDAYETLLTALRTSGQTIDDLFKMLAEVPKLRDQLDEMKDELDDLRLGVGILTAQLVKRNIPPEWHPRTMRAEAEIKPAVKRSGFGR